MGRPKGKRTERDDVSVKLDRAVVSRAKMIANYEAKYLAEYLTEILSPIIDLNYAQLMVRLDECVRNNKIKCDSHINIQKDHLELEKIHVEKPNETSRTPANKKNRRGDD